MQKNETEKSSKIYQNKEEMLHMSAGIDQPQSNRRERIHSH